MAGHADIADPPGAFEASGGRIGARRASITVGADHLAVGARADAPPDHPPDRVLDKPHAPVGEADIDAARVGAAGRVGESEARIAPRAATEPTTIVAVVRGLEDVEH